MELLVKKKHIAQERFILILRRKLESEKYNYFLLQFHFSSTKLWDMKKKITNWPKSLLSVDLYQNHRQKIVIQSAVNSDWVSMTIHYWSCKFKLTSVSLHENCSKKKPFSLDFIHLSIYIGQINAPFGENLTKSEIIGLNTQIWNIS